jgi:hypothetical protein
MKTGSWTGSAYKVSVFLLLKNISKTLSPNRSIDEFEINLYFVCSSLRLFVCSPVRLFVCPSVADPYPYGRKFGFRDLGVRESGLNQDSLSQKQTHFKYYYTENKICWDTGKNVLCSNRPYTVKQIYLLNLLKNLSSQKSVGWDNRFCGQFNRFIWFICSENHFGYIEAQTKFSVGFSV